MKPPERRELANIIASPCLIRKDRAGRALFISDYPVRIDHPQDVESKLKNRGFVCQTLKQGLVLIDWSKDMYSAYFDSLPPISLPPFTDDIARMYSTCRLLMAHEAPLAAQDPDILSLCLRLAMLGEKEKLLRTLQGALAIALRERRAPPYHGARLCLAFFGQQYNHLGGK